MALISQKSYEAHMIWALSPQTSVSSLHPRFTYSSPATLTSSPSTHLPQGLCTCCALCLVYPPSQIVTRLDPCFLSLASVLSVSVS